MAPSRRGPTRRPGAWAPLLALLIALTSCQGGESPPAAPAESTSVRPFAEVLAAHTPELMAIPGVLGVYEGLTRRGQHCVRIIVERRTRELDAKLPKTLEGWPVEIEDGGPIRPMDAAR